MKKQQKQKMHVLTVPDWIWQAHRNSPMMMRDVLAQSAKTLAEDEARDNGTKIIAGFETTCPVCKKKVTPGMEAYMVGGKAVHEECV